MKKIVLLRHGESAWNKENRFTGWTDVDLTEKGVAEALKAGELLAEELRLAQQNLSEITGEFTSDDLLGRIFSSFCIGK